MLSAIAAKAKQVFRTTPDVVWVLSALSVALGLIALGAGLWADTQGFWRLGPFATNVASSVTTGLFGLPVAVLLISALTDSSIRHRQRVNLQESIKGSAQRLAAAASYGVRYAPNRFETADSIGFLGLKWADWGRLERGKYWKLAMVGPDEMVQVLEIIRNEWANLKMNQRAILESGWAWVNSDIERDMDRVDTVHGRLSDVLQKGRNGTWESGGDLFETDDLAETVQHAALVLLQSEHVANTFAFD